MPPAHSSGKPQHAKEPPIFDGKPSQFKEWAFSIELAILSLGITDSSVMVDYQSRESLVQGTFGFYTKTQALIWRLTSTHGQIARAPAVPPPPPEKEEDGCAAKASVLIEEMWHNFDLP